MKAVSSVGVFLLLAVPGFLLTKKKILTGRQVEGLSSVLVNFLWPAMVVDAMAQVQASRELVRQAGQAALWALVVIAVGAVCAWIWLKVGKIGSVPGGILVFAAAFANTGLIGMPLIRLLLGEEMLFLASIVELVNDVLIFTVGILLIQTGCGRPRQAALRGLLSPGLAGVAIGFLLFATGFTLPGFAAEALSMAADATAPMVLLLVGAQLGEGDLKALVRDKKAWILTALRLFVIPAAVPGPADGCGADSGAAVGHAGGHLLRPVYPAVRRRLGPGHPVRDAVHPVRSGDGAPVANGDYFVNKWEQFEKNLGIACKMKTDTL